MTRKQPLYAVIAAFVCCSLSAPSYAERAPCGACVHPAVRAADWDEEYRDALALVLNASEVLKADGKALADAHTARTVVVELGSAGTLEETIYKARQALAAVRGANPSAQLGIIGSPESLDALLGAGLAAYVDFVVTEGDPSRVPSWKREHSGLRVWTTVPFVSFEQLVDASVAIPASADGALIWPPIVPTIELVADLGTFASLFPDGLVPMDEGTPQCDPADICHVAQYARADTRERIVVVRRTARPPSRAFVRLSAPRADMFAVVSHVGASPSVSDSFLALAPAVADPTGVIGFWLPMTGVSHLIARIPPPEQPIAEAVSVVGARQLTIDEIVARHQAQASRQSALVRSLITRARTTVTFEVPAFPAPVTVQADTEIVQRGGTTVVAERHITVNGVAFSETSFPRLPVIEPERVAAPPLAITLSRAYRYRLAGKDAVKGRPVYVVSFDPADNRASLFQGRAWIDASTFAVLRIDAVQTNLHGPITSSQQVQEFELRAIGGDTVSLLERSDIRQIYQGAGVTTPIHRVMLVDGHEINAEDPDSRLRAAEQERAVLLRDTGEGLHYIDGGRGRRVFALAGGLLIDPNISNPLPFAGVNYSDFDFLGVGAQVNAFFGGAYGQFALSLPSIAGTRWQLAGSGFAMLARYNDRAFRAGREQYAENLSQRPAHVSAGVLRPLDPRTSGRIEYVFDHVALDRNDSTSAQFVVPADQAVHAVRLSLERQQFGWRVVGWWSPAKRAGWRPWGFPGSGDYSVLHRGFQRFGLNLSRSWVLSPRLLTRLEAGWMGGSGLDRFSRYAFDSFENRLHGYPSASVRYDRGAVLRTTIVAQPGGRLRLDGFADVAVVRDRGYGVSHRAYPGVGAAIEAPGPFGLLLGAEWGYGFQGLDTNNHRGTQVVRLTAYKLF